MKLVALTTGLVFIAVFSVFSQPHGAGQERVKSMKIAFLTDRMELTPEEAQRFWPVYNAYEEALRKARAYTRPSPDLKTMSEAELERFVSRHLDLQEAELRIKREYFTRMKRDIPLRKIALFIRAEGDFNRKLIQTLQKQGPPPGRN